MRAGIALKPSTTGKLTEFFIYALAAPLILIRRWPTSTRRGTPSFAASAASSASGDAALLGRAWALADACALALLACGAAAAFVVSLSVNQTVPAALYLLTTALVGWAAVESLGLAGEP